MKQLKLHIHQKNFREEEEELIINPKDYPSLKVGDIVEIYLPDDEHSRLLLQVRKLSEDWQQKDTISIEQSIASCFQLRTFADVIVNVVDPKDVALDSVELTFKDQYLARSDMWRLKKSMVNTCVYPNKKIELYGIRCQVFEMWAQGERVACGVVTEDTKIVFRSSSSMVYLFIQMSSEMWDFDINGDLYFEKAINGFLSDLFAKWKKCNCNHDVTIVLFSRTFYDAQSIDQFPSDMQECLRRDHKGRFYEDFYRVVVQNERYEDWSSTIISLKKVFNQYEDLVLKHHHQPGVQIPRAVNSTSSQGNFLEVLNMSLNVFEKHYMDRSFDRTGQLSVVLSPGVGVFEVDRELSNITKQRIIDNGIGSDLVCLGEQPLHAVPLFKISESDSGSSGLAKEFYNKNSTNASAPAVDDYNMPHWINLSFYSSCKHISYANFIPRIKLPSPLSRSKKVERNNRFNAATRSRHMSQPDPSFPSVFDYDEYDAQVFKHSAQHAVARGTHSLQRTPTRRRSTHINHREQQRNSSGHKNHSSDEHAPRTHHAPEHYTKALPSGASSAAISIPQRHINSSGLYSCPGAHPLDSGSNRSLVHMFSKDDIDVDLGIPQRAIVGSAGTCKAGSDRQDYVMHRPRALINPFDPSHVTIKLTSNRRRWTHVFPLGPTGIFMQQHHYQAVPQNTAATLVPPDLDGDTTETQKLLSCSGRFRNKTSHRAVSQHTGSTSMDAQADQGTTWIWGATGEQEWTPALTTGVDWKSLVIPACLPITTDYLPDKRSLKSDFVVTAYSLLPEDISLDLIMQRCYRGEEDKKNHVPMKATQVFEELVCQRLQQGFQIIVIPPKPASATSHSSPNYVSPVAMAKKNTYEYMMSIGRIFHTLTLDGLTVTVTQYKPRHPYQSSPIRYHYRFRPPDNDTYGVSSVEFVSESLENYNWNHLDHYVCIRGEGEFELREAMKFWRLRMLLLPGSHPSTKRIVEGHERCDCYTDLCSEEKAQQQEGFLKFLEHINRIRRPAGSRKTMPEVGSKSTARRFSLTHTSSSAQNQAASAQPFRERVGSNRVHDRPRPRAATQSGKIMERPRPMEHAAGKLLSAANENEHKLTGSNSSLEGTVEGSSGEDGSNTNPDAKVSSLSTPHSEIIDSMKNPSDGLNFLNRQGLPPFTFISAEAVAWIKDRIEGVTTEHQAVQLLQTFLNEGYLCHASGVASHPFKHGFYLYYLTSQEKDKNNFSDTEYQQGADLDRFEKEWLEVELVAEGATDAPVLSFPFDSLDLCSKSQGNTEPPNFRKTNVDIDVAGKSGRMEWGHVRYHSMFRSGEAFEIAIEWMVATGNIMGELVQGWARKASSCGLLLIPIPSDPFACPSSLNSDPLRGPIFIPLNLQCLPESADEKYLQGEHLMQFQERILQRFGFIPFRDPSAMEHHQYVHISGSMFVLLQTDKAASAGCIHTAGSPNRLVSEALLMPSPRHNEALFPGSKSSLRQEEEEQRTANTKIGFLWSWNYMITKRWKTAATGDDQFMRKVLKDMKAFCSNEDGRFKEFWDLCWLGGFQNESTDIL